MTDRGAQLSSTSRGEALLAFTEYCRVKRGRTYLSQPQEACRKAAGYEAPTLEGFAHYWSRERPHQGVDCPLNPSRSLPEECRQRHGIGQINGGY
ncbi:MAG: hypothetical protein QW057_04165 [Candidatus Bathyarchaeia archaeon]